MLQEFLEKIGHSTTEHENLHEGDLAKEEGAGDAVAEEPLTEEQLKLREIRKLKKKRYQENKKRKWYQSKVNNYIYVQGLPDDITEAELKEYFVRCGVIRLDPYSGQE